MTSPANFRDLGGLPCATGSLRPGLLYRSDDLSAVPEEFVADLVADYGIRHVIDLRSSHELGVLHLLGESGLDGSTVDRLRGRLVEQ